MARVRRAAPLRYAARRKSIEGGTCPVGFVAPTELTFLTTH